MFFNLLDSGAGNEGSPVTLILFGVLIAGMIGLMIWQSISGKKKQKQAQEMVNALKKGDRVKTIGGVCGFVYEINDAENTFVLETGTDDKKSYVKFDKGAIYQTAPAKGNAVVEEKVEEKKEEVKEPAKKKTAKAKAETAEVATAPAEEVKEENK